MTRRSVHPLALAVLAALSAASAAALLVWAPLDGPPYQTRFGRR